MKTMPFITKLSSLGYLSNMHPLPPENRNQTVIAVSFQPLGENIYFCYSLRVYYQLNGSCLSIDVQHKFNFGIVFFIDMDWPLEWTVGDNHCRKKTQIEFHSMNGMLSIGFNFRFVFASWKRRRAERNREISYFGIHLCTSHSYSMTRESRILEKSACYSSTICIPLIFLLYSEYPKLKYI